MLKQSDDHRGGSKASRPDGEVPQLSALEGRVIFRIPQDFDINEVFRSEEDFSEDKTSVPQELVRVVTTAVIDPPASDQSPARVAAFEPRPADQPADNPPPASGAILSVADLIENNVRLEWQEAVAIARRLCGAAGGGDSAPSVQRSLVEPWNIEITDHGDVRVLGGGPGSDPTVKDVGRILGSLLQGSLAPVDLRLLASQASFDVPLFGSVKELSQALKHFERPGESDDIRKAFYRGVEAKFSAPVGPVRDTVAIHAATEQPKLATDSAPSKPKALVENPKINRPRLVRVSAIAVASLAVVLVLTWALLPRQQSAPASAGVPVPVAAAVVAAGDRELPQESPEPFVGPSDTTPARRAEATPPPDAPTRATPQRIVPVVPPRPALVPSSPARAAELVPDSASRRATELLASRRTEEATLAFDAIVMAQPFYQAPPGSTPEMLAALRASKRSILPTLARSRFENARAEFELGDVDRALADGRIAATMLKDSDSTVVPDLMADVDKFLALVFGVKAAEELKVYTISDQGIVPPVALGLQLPGAPPPGVTPYNVGQLEMIIGRSGQVESVRLHTPANRYAERMIVSAAKAWKYRPALRNGKPVRFNLFVTINLPES